MNNNKAFLQCSILIMILALAVVSCSSAADLSSLFATQTLTPTVTFTPTLTFTPSPTATATHTPSPTPRPTGVFAEEQADGTTLFVDYDNGYQLLLPANWVIVFSSQEEVQQAILESSRDDPEFAEMADNFRDADPDVFRLAAMNAERELFRASGPTLLTINAYDDKLTSSMPMAFITAVIEDTILEGAESTNWEVATSTDGVEVGVVQGTRSVSLANGRTLQLQEMVLVFASNDKLIVVDIAAPQEVAEQVMASFDASIDSIEVHQE